ncbi:MAG: hypothetical protein ABIH48_02910, partial [Candidatus Falkowbacteria bacterium]
TASITDIPARPNLYNPNILKGIGQSWPVFIMSAIKEKGLPFEAFNKMMPILAKGKLNIN